MSRPAHSVKKSRQHHVWQQYLRAWATGGRIFCLQGGRLFATGTAVLAMETDFYKVETLTDEDLDLIKLLAFHDKQHPRLRESNERYLRYVLTPAILSKRYTETRRNAELQELLDTYNTNVVDQHHTILESSFVPLLAQSLREDISWYENGVNRIAFFTFIAAQNLRTRRVKSETIARLRDEMGLDMSRIWNILAVILAFNAGFSMYAEPHRRPLTLVRNETAIPFITGDQPLTNLAGGGETAPEFLAFYYPLSPRLALYLGGAGRPPDLPPVVAIADTVIDLNLRIARASHSQLFAATANVLADVKERTDRTA
jgi:hypothetical protein